jgi:hypothetical protein
MGDGVSTESRGQDHARPARGRYGRTLRMGFVLDVAGYGARSAPLRSDVQRSLPRLVSEMLANCGMDLHGVEHEWTGDGINAIMPADVDPSTALPILIRTLAALLSEHNARASDRIRLRMAVGIGLVENSTAGFGGPMIIDMSRLVNSAPLRAALTAHPGADLVAAISDQVHSAIIQPGYPGIPGSQFTRAQVSEKEFNGTAWIWISARQWTTPAFGSLTPGDPRHVGEGTSRYRLLARLGTGPAATVYLATPAGAAARARALPAPPAEPRPGRLLAVKVFRPEVTAGAEARGRLAAGVKAAAGAGGPGVAGIVSADTQSGVPWIASALVPGPSLAAVVAETGPLATSAALWLAAELARAVRDLHAAGVTHGSLRPSNVLLSADGPVVTDAGTGSTVITVADGTELSPAADVLALGCVAFFAATGRVPYGGSPASTDRLPRPLDELDLAGCPPGLLPVVRACLQPAPDRPTAQAILTRLEGVAGPMPRTWLPPAVAARLADYADLPGPPAPPRPRLDWRSHARGLGRWLRWRRARGQRERT